MPALSATSGAAASHAGFAKAAALSMQVTTLTGASQGVPSKILRLYAYPYLSHRSRNTLRNHCVSQPQPTRIQK